MSRKISLVPVLISWMSTKSKKNTSVLLESLSPDFGFEFNKTSNINCYLDYSLLEKDLNKRL